MNKFPSYTFMYEKTPGEFIDNLLLFEWFLPSPSPHSSSCVPSGWFWRWLRSPLPGVSEPCGLAAEGWRRSPALAVGSGSSCRSLWKSQRSPVLMDSQMNPVGPQNLRLRVTSWSLKTEMSLVLMTLAGLSLTTGVEISHHNRQNTMSKHQRLHV